MFLEMGKPDDDRLKGALAAFAPWVVELTARDRYISWVVISPEGEPVATAGLMILDWPPNRSDLQPLRAYLMNVYTNPDHRNRGIANWLVETALAESRRRKIRVTALHASDQGRALYEGLGFRPSREMMRVEKND